MEGREGGIAQKANMKNTEPKLPASLGQYNNRTAKALQALRFRMAMSMRKPKMDLPPEVATVMRRWAKRMRAWGKAHPYPPETRTRKQCDEYVRIAIEVEERCCQAANLSQNETNYRMILAGRAAANQLAADMLRPHAKRGKKILRNASQGGREAARQLHEPKRKEYRAALAEYLRDNQNVSLTTARARIAARFGISRRTLERHTRDMSKK